MSKEEQLKFSIGGRTNVRFTSIEYKQVKKDSSKLCKSIPTLLRDAYFNRLPTKVLVNQKDLDILRKDMNRIGNNLNQVAKKLNSGFMHGWSDTLDKVLEEFKKLNRLIYHGHGLR
jgi:hypothetical protein